MDSHASTIRVAIAHSEPLIAAGVLYALTTASGFSVTATLHPSATRYDVLISDLSGAMQLRATVPPTKNLDDRLIVLAAAGREMDIRRALANGVHGYLLANCQTEELVQCVRSVAQGGRYLSMAIAHRIADSMSREPLTARESDVLHLLVKGQCNKSIARALAISVGTVKTHVKAILAKLDATSRTHAVYVAVERGLVA